MQKTQKLWLSLALSLFLIPEILWSPISNFAYIFFENSNNTLPLRINFITQSDPGILYRTIVLIQVFGLLAIFIQLLKDRGNYSTKLWYYLLLFFSFGLLCISVFIFYLITFLNISFP